MIPSMAAASRTPRVIGPTWSSEALRRATPLSGTRPCVGLRPTTPLAADGKRIEPPVSEPREPKHRPAAVATPEPLEEMPDQRSGFHGLRGGVTVG